MKVTVVGFTIPDAMLTEINRRDANMATQTHRFAWAVVQGLRHAGVEVDLLSAAPVSDYPRNPSVLFTRGDFQAHGVPGRYIPFINLVVAKHVSRLVGAFIAGRSTLRRSKRDWLLVHGVHSPFLWFAVAARRWFGMRVAVLLTDPPGVVVPSDSYLRRLMKRLDISVARTAISRMDAVIVLTERLAQDFAPGLPYLVMEGLFDNQSWRFESFAGPNDGQVVVTYAGGLSAEYGVDRLAHAVCESDLANVRLQMFGRGPLEGWLQGLAERDRRICAPRLVEASELSRIYVESSILVQPRPVDQEFVRYSFPSKLIEYLASGTPVISTRLPTIPPEYGEFLAWTEDSSSGIRDAIADLLKSPSARRSEMGAAAAAFIRGSRSVEVQGARMREFLADVERRREVR